MFAVTAARIDADDPLAGLELGERPEPAPPEGWTTVTVRATALNHHDVWTLRGVGISADRLPIVLGCDAAGMDEDGNEVVVHSVISRPAVRRVRRDPRSGPVAAVRALRRHVRAAGGGAPAQPGAQARRPVLRGGRLPAHGLPDRLPDAVPPGRDRARRDRPGPGRGRRRGHRAHPARPGGRLPGLGHQPQRGQAGAGGQAGRGPGVPVRRPAAGTGRRGHGDGRGGHLGALAARAQARRDHRDLRCHQRPGASGRPGPGLLPAALRGRVHHGHPGSARAAAAVLRAVGRPAADRPHAAAGAGPRRPGRDDFR